LEEGRTGAKPEFSKVLADVTSMKGRQDSLDSQLKSMKRENEVLWREVAILREKHRKQQHIVNKVNSYYTDLL
jgi:heat shock transcription factor 1